MKYTEGCGWGKFFTLKKTKQNRRKTKQSEAKDGVMCYDIINSSSCQRISKENDENYEKERGPERSCRINTQGS